MMRSLNKKGQFNSHFVILLIFVIIGSLFLLFGYKTISYIGNKGDEAVLIKFKTELEADIDSMSYEEGSVIEEKYSLPSNIDEICFVDLEEVDPTDIDNTIIRDSVESDVEKNLFLGVKGGSFEGFYIEDMKVLYYPYFLCIDTKTRIMELKIQGTKDGAAIKAPDLGLCRATDEDLQRESMCDGLNIFGPGYRRECCNEYNLCC